jgi:glycosyltransferase involved in cell wall biosynthesis
MRDTTARRRIVYVEGNPDGTIGGSFFSLLFLVKNLDRSRYDPIVVFSKSNDLIPEYRAAGAEVIVRPMPQPVRWSGPLMGPLRRAANVLLGFGVETLRLAQFLRAQRADILHLNNSIERNHPWMAAAVLAGVPRLTHERGINDRLSPPAKWLTRRLDAVICISRAVRENLERLGVETPNLTTIWNALDPSEMTVRMERTAVLNEFGIAPGSRLIGMVGNIKPWKGQAVVVEAMEIVARKHPDVVCLLIGDHSEADAEYKRTIDRTISDQGLQKRVIITGYRANVPDYVAALDILIHASVLPEPFGRVLLEGMALRKPLVASRGGAVPEIVEEGITGLLFEPGNGPDLADKLLRLLESPDAAQAMGAAGFDRLKNQFGIRNNAERTMALYQQILG